MYYTSMFYYYINQRNNYIIPKNDLHVISGILDLLIYYLWQEHISIFNTEVESTIEKDGMYLDTYENTLKMSSYLIAFAVGDLKKVTKKGKITVIIISYNSNAFLILDIYDICAF